MPDTLTDADIDRLRAAPPTLTDADIDAYKSKHPEQQMGQHVQAHPLKGENFGDWLSEELLGPIVSSATALGRGLQGLGHPEQRPLSQSAQDVIQGGMGITMPFAIGGLGGRESPPPGAPPATPGVVGTALKGAATGAVKAIPNAVETSILRYTGLPQIARGAITGAKQALKARAEVPPPQEAAPAALAKTPGQELAESQGQTWEKLTPEDQSFMEAIARGRQNAATQAGQPIPSNPQFTPANTPIYPTENPSSAAPTAPGKTAADLFNEEMAARQAAKAAKVQPIRPEPPSESNLPRETRETPAGNSGNSGNSAADVAKAKFAEAKGDRFVDAIQKYNQDFPDRRLTADELEAAGNEEKSMLTRGLKQGGYLKNTEEFTDESFPHIIRKLRASEQGGDLEQKLAESIRQAKARKPTQ